ncbi:hypothetical protein HK100_001944 [Physocladia obscura]|uniref:Uncharacterized protein n=1 Tax=Physocladia obscura TaxID=109957 RepID=A0AAD5SYM3_9FUNG|nr:hypothetical protein HK100_001944 [Physocladia obscura]
MKIDLVVNDDGPLSRSTNKDSVLQHNTSLSASASSSPPLLVRILETRVTDLATHLRVKFDGNFEIHQRVKMLEDALMQTEEKYPYWSLVHCDHSPSAGHADPFGSSVWTRISSSVSNASSGAVSGEAENSYTTSRFITNYSGNESGSIGALVSRTTTMTTTGDRSKFKDAETESIDRRIKELKEKLLKQ